MTRRGRLAAAVADLIGRTGGRSPRMALWVAGRHLGRGERLQAEALLVSALDKYPRHAGIAAANAGIAQDDGRYAVARDRWRAVCALRPDDFKPWHRLAESARCGADVVVAAQAATRALALRPNDPYALREVAHAYDGAARHDLAEPIWARLAARRPGDPLVRQSHAHCLLRLGRLDEAELAIEAGLGHNPDHPTLAIARGVLAMRREDWDAAYAIWSAFVAAHPDNEDGRNYLKRVASVRQIEAVAALTRPARLAAPIDVGRVEDDAIRQLMLRFESIGADCEFGTVQRRYGAEPLALLRWNDVTVETLTAALAARFAGMGEPETTELSIGPIGELYVRDRRWDLGMHTFLFAHEVSPEAMFPKLCRRVAWLRDKFLDDLAAAEKILVFKSLVLRFEDLVALHALLRAHGPVRLLHVRPAVTAGLPPWPDGAPGTIDEVAPDLFVGYVDRMGTLTDIPFDQWVSICRALAERIDHAKNKPERLDA